MALTQVRRLLRLDRGPLQHRVRLRGLVLAALAAQSWTLALPALVFGALALLGVRDVAQSRHSILVNYPVIGPR